MHFKHNLFIHLQSNTDKLKTEFCVAVTLIISLQVQSSCTKLIENKYIVTWLQHTVKIDNATYQGTSTNLQQEKHWNTFRKAVQV